MSTFDPDRTFKSGVIYRKYGLTIFLWLKYSQGVTNLWQLVEQVPMGAHMQAALKNQ